MQIEDWQEGGFGIYLHWPFCSAKCPYCDFNSHVRTHIDHSAWCDAYLSEIDRYAAMLPDRFVNSIFFGGGTPSLMEPEVVATLIERIKAHWQMSNNLEVTLEANPTSVEAGRFRAFAEAGITRISMGVQALNDKDLKRLGRVHTAAEAKQAFDIARETFNRVSFDLIYARQDQSLSEWRGELSEALNMAVDHLSLYQLTIEPETVFGARYDKGKLPGLPNDDYAADMYDVTQAVCERAGYTAYEVSNHALDDAASRHNLIYWRYGDFVGIGPGAHGRLTMGGHRFATDAEKSPEIWSRGITTQTPVTQTQRISPDEQGQEYLMMSLRLSEGASVARYARLSGHALKDNAIDHLQDLNMISVEGDRLRTTRQGRLVLNTVISALLTYREPISSRSYSMSGHGKDHLADQNSDT